MLIVEEMEGERTGFQQVGLKEFCDHFGVAPVLADLPAGEALLLRAIYAFDAVYSSIYDLLYRRIPRDHFTRRTYRGLRSWIRRVQGMRTAP
jgi:hypothetical protein